MGQYYMPVNIEKKEYIYSHDCKYKWTRDDGQTFIMGCGLKLMEHSYIGNQLMNAVENLLIPSGAWHKARIVWAGDYADNEQGAETNLYDIVQTEGTKLKPKLRKIDKKYRFLINHNKRVFIDLATIKEDKNGYKIHPLSLLVADGNGRGGGDFHGEDARIGTWARDSISIDETIPDGYTHTNIAFQEE